MRFLLDTHVLLWWLDESPRLGAEARELIADPANQPIYSVVSLWEIALKSRLGKLKADIRDIVEVADRDDFARLGIEDAHLVALAGLPPLHKDPFDQLLLAQAMAEQVPFVTADRIAPSYPVEVIRAN